MLQTWRVLGAAYAGAPWIPSMDGQMFGRFLPTRPTSHKFLRPQHLDGLMPQHHRVIRVVLLAQGFDEPLRQLRGAEHFNADVGRFAPPRAPCAAAAASAR